MPCPPKAYLAGPDVFFPGAAAIAERKKWVCAVQGIEGVTPLDNELGPGTLSPMERGHAIGKANYRLMDSCDLIVANLTPYHGPSADAGTVAELAYMFHAGKRIYAYSNDTRNFSTRVADTYGYIEADDGTRYTPDGMMIENFGTMTENCMIDTAIIESGGKFRSVAVSPKQYYTSLTAFREIVRLAACDLGVLPDRQKNQAPQPAM